MLIPRVQWIKCQGNTWCNLLTLNLDHPHFSGLEGLYIIWHGGQNPWTVYVGQGAIKDRLRAHRLDPEILRYANLGLLVTWAQVGRSDRDGVERFLADRLQPLLGARHPEAVPIAVSLPWSAG